MKIETKMSLIFGVPLIMLLLFSFTRCQSEGESFYGDKGELLFQNKGWVILQGRRIEVEFAITHDELSHGYMHRKKIKPQEGMLFFFPKEAQRYFWMKNVSVPLSVAFIDAQGVIVSISDMKPYDETNTASYYPAQYVLEMKQGEFKRLGIAVGAKMDWGEY